MYREQPCPDHGGTGTKSMCPACHREKNRRYYQENRDKVLERNRRYRQENREKITEYQRRYHRENRDYIAVRRSNHTAAKNRASKYLATNSHKTWTPQEVAKMQRLRRQGLTRYEIAVELGRTYNAVNYRIAQENARN